VIGWFLVKASRQGNKVVWGLSFFSNETITSEAAMKWEVTSRVAGERRQRLRILTAPFVQFRVPVAVKPFSLNPIAEREQPASPELRFCNLLTSRSPLRFVSTSRVTCFIWCAAVLAVVTFVSSATEVRFERWRWSNPRPHGNNVLDMLVTTDLAVQVGDGGAVFVQRTDERWAPAVSGVTNYLRGVALMGERLIAVGENGCILWSDDGNYFQPASLAPATADWFEGITASAQRAIAVGDNGSIYSSTNGVSWSRVNAGTTEWLRGVAFGNGAYVAVGENGTILRSTGGNSWSSVASGTTAHLNRVRYVGSTGSGQFIAVGNSGVALSSATGMAPWASLGSGTTNHLYDVATNDTGLLLVGDQEVRFRPTGGSVWTNQLALPTNAPPAWVYLSAYGSSNAWLVAGRTGFLLEGSRTNAAVDYTWQPSPDSSHAWHWDVTVQNGIYVAVGDLATIQTSLDGILWAREAVPVPHTNTVLLGVGGNTNLLLAVGNAGNVLLSRAGLTNLAITNYAGTNIVVTNSIFETLGVIWTQVPAFTTNTLQGIAATDNLFIVAGESGKIFTSPDATNWTARATTTANFLTSVAIGPTACVAVGSLGTSLRAGSDGASWTSVPMGTTNWLYRVRWLDGQFVVVGQNGTIYTSPDATNWTARVSGTTRWLTDVAFVAGQWFVTGYQGTLLTSSTLTNWTALPLPTIKSLYSAATQNGQLVIAGIEGVALRQQIVPQLSSVNVLGYNRSVVVSSNGAASTYELFLFGGQPDQFFQFQSTTNLAAWQTDATLELFDPGGTIYLLRTRDQTNTPPAELYRTRLVP
jgi:hypothetical protein